VSCQGSKKFLQFDFLLALLQHEKIWCHWLSYKKIFIEIFFIIIQHTTACTIWLQLSQPFFNTLLNVLFKINNYPKLTQLLHKKTPADDKTSTRKRVLLMIQGLKCVWPGNDNSIEPIVYPIIEHTLFFRYTWLSATSSWCLASTTVTSNAFRRIKKTIKNTQKRFLVCFKNYSGGMVHCNKKHIGLQEHAKHP